MAVVINEFEVVPAPPEAPASAPPPDRPAAAGPTVRDIELIVERAAQRERRVRAH